MMLADIYKSMASGKLEVPEIDSPIIAVVDFVGRILITFSDKYADSDIKNEKGLTQKLVLILNFHARREYYPFWFDKEYMENPERGDSPQVDIGTITTLEEGIVIGAKTYTDESFFSMEAKRLGNLGGKRSKEYLIGRYEKKKYIHCGGVERFKQGKHGRDLEYGAIIGYVQEHDFTYWYDRINLWIDDLIQKNLYSPVPWLLKDKLKKDYIRSTTAKFISITYRKNNFITLFHLWARLN
jgi:hypothetical protein